MATKTQIQERYWPTKLSHIMLWVKKMDLNTQ